MDVFVEKRKSLVEIAEGGDIWLVKVELGSIIGATLDNAKRLYGKTADR